MNSKSEGCLSRRDLLISASTAPLVAALSRVAGAAEPARRIGFVDLKLDNFHANIYLGIFRNQLKDRGFTVGGATATDAESGKQWAQKNNVPWHDDVASLDKQVDFFAIFAPSNPEVHLELAERTLPLAKPTFIDKTFAPNHETAKKIFALADKHATPIQTASALRYTAVQEHVAKIGRDRVRHVTTFSPGGSFDEYIVHSMELAVSCLGPEATRLFRPSDSQMLIEFRGGRTATINLFVKSRTPYAAMVTTDEASEYFVVDTGRLFIDAAAAMLNFFESGKNDIDRREPLTIMQLIDAARQPEARNGYVDTDMVK